MKKRILSMALVAEIVVCLVGCGTTTTYQEATEQTESDESRDFGNGFFTIISKWEDTTNNYKIVYANDTKVKYFVCNTGYKFGITPLYNADGTLQIYEESEN